MKSVLIKVAMKFRIIESCPNCDSAWTGGCPNPEYRRWCLICGPGPMGWVWGWIVPMFIQHRWASRRLEEYQAIVEHINNQDKIKGRQR